MLVYRRVYTPDFPSFDGPPGHERVTRKVPSCQDLSSHAAQMMYEEITWTPPYIIETIGYQ